MTNVMVEEKEIKLTNLDKILWPKGITKGMYIEYMVKIGPTINKYLENRPLVFTRYPDGINGENFYEKNCPHYAPHWIKKQTIENTRYVIGEGMPTLVWIANRASIEIHPWHSRVGTIDNPDYGIFDLDPMEKTDFSDCLEIAIMLKDLLEKFKLKCYPKTSGSSGLQVYLPVKNQYTYHQVKEVVQFFSTMIARVYPQKATVERMVKNREGKVYMDYLQMIKGKTIIAPYCPRPKENGTVSAPLRWDEVKRGVNIDDFTMETILERIQKVGDIFEPIIYNNQSIDNVLKYIKENKKEIGM